MPDDRPALASADLYEQDFYLWTRAQAEALRAHGAGDSSLDYDRLAEEIEDLGSAQRNAAESHVRQIIVHLFKLAWSNRTEPRGHWRGEVLTHRADSERLITRAIRNELEQELERLHKRAAQIAESSFVEHEPDAAIDVNRRWTLAQILGEEDDPVPPR